MDQFSIASQSPSLTQEAPQQIGGRASTPRPHFSLCEE